MGFDVSVQPKTVQRTVYDNVSCDRCDARPDPIFDAGADGSLQYDNLLVLRFTGGYGMFCDPDASLTPRPEAPLDPELTTVLCHDCGHDLADWLGINVAGWHTHRPDSDRLDEHHGPDGLHHDTGHPRDRG